METFVVPVGDPNMKLEWFLNKEPLLFKSSFTPVYDYGFIGLSINKVYPDDFGEFSVRVSNKYGSCSMESWVGEYPAGQDPGKCCHDLTPPTQNIIKGLVRGEFIAFELLHKRMK